MDGNSVPKRKFNWPILYTLRPPTPSLPPTPGENWAPLVSSALPSFHHPHSCSFPHPLSPFPLLLIPKLLVQKHPEDNKRRVWKWLVFNMINWNPKIRCSTRKWTSCQSPLFILLLSAWLSSKTKLLPKSEVLTGHKSPQSRRFYELGRHSALKTEMLPSPQHIHTHIFDEETWPNKATSGFGFIQFRQSPEERQILQKRSSHFHSGFCRRIRALGVRAFIGI